MNEPDPKPLEKLATGEPIRVLNVDDSADFRALVKEVLEKEHRGFEVTEAASRAEFESRLAERAYDLVLTDFHMQNFLGLHVLDAIQAKDPRVPVVIFSGTGSEASAVECMKRGATDYVLKSPEQVQQLAQTIQAAIEKQRLLAERARAVEALRESEERYRSLFENAHDLVYTHDLDGNFTSYNKTAERISGYPRDQALQMNIADLVAAESLAKVRTMIDRKLADSDATIYEVEIITRNGSRVPLEVATKLIYRQGQPVGVQGIGRDITERKRAAAALAESENRLRTIIETQPECVKLLARDGTLLEMNPAGLAMLEATSVEDVVGHSVFPIIAPEHQRNFRALLDAVFRGESSRLEFEVIGLKGTRRWLETHAVPLRDPADPGNIKAQLSVTRDISERKRAEETLRRTEELYRQAIIGAGAVPYLHDYKTETFTFIGEGIQQMTGYTAQEMTPKLWNQISLQVVMRGEAAGLTQEEARRRTRAGEFLHWQSDGLILTRDGEKRWIADNSIEILDEHGTPTGSIGILQDITERKRTEQELLRLATAVEQSTESIIIIGLNGAIEYVNPACERITGFPRQELLGRPFDFILQGKDVPFNFKEITDKIAAAGIWMGRFNSRKKDLTPFAEEASISPIRNADGQIINYIALNRDVTKEAALEEQVRLAQKMEAIGLLAGGVAHDFNNILQVIQGFTTLAKDEANTREERDSYLDQVTQAATRAGQLTRQLLAFGRRQPLQRVDTDLNQVVSDQLSMLQRLIGEHIEVEFIPGRELDNVRADRSQLEQVLLNLCVNSRDAMPGGGRLIIHLENAQFTVDFLAHNAWARRGRFVLLRVTDTGEGIDKETINRIFEPFFTTKPKDKGTGLGLAMVYGIIKQHEGMVQVESEPGAGTTFRIYLPVAERGKTSEGRKGATGPPKVTETILLAEDEPQVRALAIKILERAGYRVIPAVNGEEAVNLFKDNPGAIDLLVFDVVMPKMGGREAHDRIKALKPDVPVLFCSGYSGTALMAGFELAADVQLLQKPYSAEALLGRIRQLRDGAKS
ncbi:MAG: PAS domain S-box protein [Verrucomicrobia bacterium]|nr:PAS domain S-box protein [Verrucomicrobiota bacterium]